MCPRSCKPGSDVFPTSWVNPSQSRPVPQVRFLRRIKPPGWKPDFHWPLKARTSKSAPSAAHWPSDAGRSAGEKAPPSALRRRVQMLALRRCDGDSIGNLLSPATVITARPRRPWSSFVSKLDRESSCEAHGSTCKAAPRICFRDSGNQVSAWPPDTRSVAPRAQACNGRRLRFREPHDNGSTSINLMPC